MNTREACSIKTLQIVAGNLALESNNKVNFKVKITSFRLDQSNLNKWSANNLKSSVNSSLCMFVLIRDKTLNNQPSRYTRHNYGPGSSAKKVPSSLEVRTMNNAVRKSGNSAIVNKSAAKAEVLFKIRMTYWLIIARRN